jgi:hypothetical protein
MRLTKVWNFSNTFAWTRWVNTSTCSTTTPSSAVMETIFSPSISKGRIYISSVSHLLFMCFFCNIYHQFFALQNNFYTLQQYIIGSWINDPFFCMFFGGLGCIGHSFAYVTHLLFFEKYVAGFEPSELP